jgi:hypothetical protein
VICYNLAAVVMTVVAMVMVVVIDRTVSWYIS